ncbi:sigma-70 family RNA polymerase sigma factor [Paludisphaera soli]|uniref:sigma-70 family RNA polymerase sigma factor n=1 Tax=Paludisphaera soli TaxID=2712865 RepID=UPI0013EB0D83|nr:sigma-70 family RNA polymerase sigma factor [Paludisphaera soli]
MGRGPTNETFRRIRALYATGPVGDLDDARLLERFAVGEGLDREDAFAALVRRHGPMVLSVCRRMLDGHGPGRTDADDAFQAVFLILARKAGSLRRPDDLRPWLYGVAVRTGKEARRRALRLRDREGGPLDDALAAPAPADADLADLRAALDEELERLPGRYREPILLCELEGASRRDAASRLGLAEGTLSSRLARGRNLLRDRLARRGLAVGSLGAALVPRPATAGLAALVDASTRLAANVRSPHAGTVPASVAALAEGVLAMLAAARWKAAASSAAGLAALALTAGLAWGYGGLAPQPDPAPAVAPADEPEPAKQTGPVRLRGVVVDEADRPLAGAEVRLDPESIREVRATTGPDGAYEMAVDRPNLGNWTILARTDDGRSAGLLRVDRELTPAQAQEPARIVVRPSREVRVRVADAAGDPAAGVTVEAVAAYNAVAHETTGPDGEARLLVPADAVVPWITAQKPAAGFDYAEFGEGRAGDRVEGVKADALPAFVALTLGEPRTVRIRAVDEEGRPAAGVGFYVWLLKRDDRASVVNYASRIHHETTGPDGVATFDWLPRSKYSLAFWPMGDGITSRRIVIEEDQPDEVSARLERDVKIRGRVTRPDGSPARGIKVLAFGSGRGNDRGYERTRTDDEGRYTLQVPPGETYAVWVDDRDWTAPARMDVVAPAGRPIEGVDIGLVKGTLVKGRLTVGPDRRPATQAWVHAQQTRGAAPDDPREGGEAADRRVRMFANADVEPDGSYALRLPPGTYELTGPVRDDRSTLVVGDEPVLIRDFHMDRPERGRFSGRVVDESGKPAAGARVEIAEVSGIPFTVVADADGRFQTERRLERTYVCVKTADGGLGALVEVGPDEPEVALVLAPTATATGRILDEKGEPARREKLEWGFQVHDRETRDGTSYTAFAPEVVTDDEGRFTLPPLVVGQRYEIRIRRDDVYHLAGVAKPDKPGLMDLGDLSVGSERAASTFRDDAPDVGDVAPPIDATTLDGEPLRLSDFAGKYVLLGFWATWCGPCLAEEPHIRAAYDAFGKDGRLAIVGLSLDESIDAPRKFQDEHKVPWTMAFLNGGTQGPNAAYGVRAIPSLVLVGPDGKIVARGLRGAGIQAAVAKALSAKP